MNKEELREKLKQLEEDNYQERLHLHGKLLALIKKELKEEKDQVLKAKLKIEYYEELQTHKKIIELCKGKEEFISIPKKVGLKVQEIALAIEIFKNKHDIIEKLKRAGISSIPSGLLVVAISVGLAAVTGGVSLATLAATIPSLSYVGLSSLLRSFTTETPMEKLISAYDNKEENQKKLKDYLQKYIIDNKTLHELLNKNKECKDRKEKQQLLTQIIEQFQFIMEDAPTDDIKVALQCEQTNFMKELKSSYEKEKEDFIQDKIKMSVEDFAKLEKKIISLNMNIIENEYFLKDAVKDSIKNTGTSLAIMIVARTILSAAFPSMAITSVKDLLTPAMIITLTNLLNIPSYKDKIPVVPTKYDNQKIKIDKEKWKALVDGGETRAMQMV